MPRLARNLLQGKELFHIMVQGIKKENIFFEEREKYEYIKLLNKYTKEYDIKTLSYCVMDNHSHILIDTKNIKELTKYMHKLNTSYAIYYNKNKSRVGYVYRDRFKTQVIEDERHLYNCILYIHNNPVKAGICKQAGEYKYSSYKKFFNDKNSNMLTSIFQSKKEYIIAHSKMNMLTNDFIEVEEDKEKEIVDYIENYLNINKIDKRDLYINKEELIPIVLELYNIYKLSNRQLEKYLNVSREKIRKILNKLD